MFSRRIGVALVLLSTVSVPTFADDSPILAKVKATGTINLGHRESSIPFSYYDDKRQVIGYSHELMMKIVEAIKTETKRPDLKVNLIPITSANRIPLVQNGTIDLECGSTTNNIERQKQVAFSNSIFAIGTRLLVKKDAGIKDFDDLKGKNVVVTAGTTSERLLRKMNDENKMRMNIVSAKDHGESFLALEGGQAVAFMMDDALLYGEIAKAKRPGDWAVVGTQQSFEPYGCMMRKDDPTFKNLVDAVVADTMRSGEIEKIYAKWFLNPIPPKGLSLNFPMSDNVKMIYQSPHDWAFD
jgi:glutamate/aspartate transport system substrate-binding protein